MGFFTEQFQPPDRVTYEVQEALPGTLKEVSRQGGGVIARELQAQIFVTLPVARSLIAWLQHQTDQAEAIVKAQAHDAKGTDSAVETKILEAEDNDD